MAPTPPALTVSRLIDDDAVDPGAEGGLPSEAADGAEHTQEDFLRQVERLVAITEQVKGEAEDHPLMRRDEIRAGQIVAGRTALDERRFAAIDFRPADGASVLHNIPRGGSSG
jgi:hypothetical protein